MAVAVRPHSSSACGREATAAGRLFEEHADRILGFCLRELGSRSEAEDALQTTFLYAHRALQRGIVPQGEYVWLHAIARNVCRWQRRTSIRRDRLHTAVELDVAASPPSSEAEDSTLVAGLAEALASIPENQQRALVLREWHGLTSREVAAQLGMSSPATYALLTRARRSLAQALTALPEKAALSVITLVYELRANIRALFGGSAAVKTVAATTMAAAVAVGGVSIERVARGDRGVPHMAPAGVASERSAVQTRPVGQATRPVRNRAVNGAAASRISRLALAVPAPAVGLEDAPTPESSPGEGVDASQPPGDTGEAPAPDPVGPPELVPEPPALPLPPLPPLPTDVLPPAPELPPAPAVSPPAVGVPAVELPVPAPPDPGLPNLLP